MTRSEDIVRAVDATSAAYGGLDVAVSASGVSAAPAPVAEIDEAT